MDEMYDIYLLPIGTDKKALKIVGLYEETAEEIGDIYAKKSSGNRFEIRETQGLKVADPEFDEVKIITVSDFLEM